MTGSPIDDLHRVSNAIGACLRFFCPRVTAAGHPWLGIFTLSLAFFGIAPQTLRAQAISPSLVANNLWYANSSAPSSSPGTAVMNLAGEAGIRFIRIGGAGFDGGMPSDAALLTWVNRIRAIGAEPIIQVSQYRTATQAAATVQFLNVTSGANVTYWSIGNEPWLQANQNETPDPTEAQIATRIATYFKSRAAAMKLVDPAIKIFG
ncbi:hypothetical protein HQ447_17910, partial [bacterium]|nr:hypothetical protein [bacterium]